MDEQILSELQQQKGMIFDIKRFAIHDGSGIRTTVFLKGCNMTCWWCHNPESRKLSRELFMYVNKCRLCGRCVDVCPNGAHLLIGNKHVFEENKCDLCGRCVSECSFGALRIVGEEKTAGEVMCEVVEDKHYYDVSGGGLTISGGEPILQIDFTYALLKLAKEEGLNTVLDTNGSKGRREYEKLLPLVDTFFIDVKQTDEDKHRVNCGVGWSKVEGNIRWLNDKGSRIVLRCPIIPEFNAEDIEHWHKVARLAQELNCVEAIEYLPYHRLWISKLEGLFCEVDEHKRNLPEISREEIRTIEAILRICGKDVRRG